MVRSGLAEQLIADLLIGAALHQLLEHGFVVLALVLLPQIRLLQQFLQNEAPWLLQTAGIQIHGGDQRLHHVRQDGGAFPPPGALLAFAQTHITTQIQTLRDAVEAGLAHQLGAKPGHPPLRDRRLLPIEKVRRHMAQDRVAQEFQPLIALAAIVPPLVGVGTVGQGRLQQTPVPEAISDFSLKLLHITPLSVSYRRYAR